MIQCCLLKRCLHSACCASYGRHDGNAVEDAGDGWAAEAAHPSPIPFTARERVMSTKCTRHEYTHGDISLCLIIFLHFS
jgi:hypothetical protein